ncbi:MAG: hypothetical protein AAF806_23560 [Bacteroidota bacterium]
MQSYEVKDEQSARIVDLLEQVKSVNEMINLYEDDEFMKIQYEHRKGLFVQEIWTLLADYDIDYKNIAA